MWKLLVLFMIVVQVVDWMQTLQLISTNKPHSSGDYQNHPPVTCGTLQQRFG